MKALSRNIFYCLQGLKEQTNKPSRVPLGKAKSAAVRNKENGKKVELKPKVVY